MPDGRTKKLVPVGAAMYGVSGVIFAIAGLIHTMTVDEAIAICREVIQDNNQYRESQKYAHDHGIESVIRRLQELQKPITKTKIPDSIIKYLREDWTDHDIERFRDGIKAEFRKQYGT